MQRAHGRKWRPRLRTIAKVGLPLLAVPVMVTIAAPAQADTPTAGVSKLGGGPYTCATASPNTNCLHTWTAPDYTGVYIVPDYQSTRPPWVGGVATAATNWRAAPGPQSVFVDQAYNYYSWTFVEDSVDGDTRYWPLGLDVTGADGLTLRCLSTGQCIDQDYPHNDYYSIILLNHTQLDKQKGCYFVHTIAHELGHALGLYHQTNGRPSVMVPTINRNGTFYLGPQPDDIGATAPVCKSDAPGGPGGVRCVFQYIGWTDAQGSVVGPTNGSTCP
jgi:hypothetical protein